MREKKARNFGPPPFGNPTLRGAHPSGLRGPTLRLPLSVGPPFGPHHDINSLVFAEQWPKDGVEECGQNRSLSFSQQRVHCLEERSKAEEVENYRYTSAPMGERLKLFFAQLFLFISSVSSQQSQIRVMNTVLVKQERGDPYWQDNLTHCSSQQNY